MVGVVLGWCVSQAVAMGGAHSDDRDAAGGEDSGIKFTHKYARPVPAARACVCVCVWSVRVVCAVWVLACV